MTRTYARIENGTVAELLTSAETPQTLFHPALHWVDVTGQGVAVGWREAAGSFTAPPPPAPAAPPSVAELKQQLAALALQVAALAGG